MEVAGGIKGACDWQLPQALRGSSIMGCSVQGFHSQLTTHNEFDIEVEAVRL